jgi:hypothetical protein
VFSRLRAGFGPHLPMPKLEITAHGQEAHLPAIAMVRCNILQARLKARPEDEEERP